MYITEVTYIKFSYLNETHSCMFHLQKAGKVIKKMPLS